MPRRLPIPITARFAPPSPEADTALSDALALLLQSLPLDEERAAAPPREPRARESRGNRATETAGGTLP